MPKSLLSILALAAAVTALSGCGKAANKPLSQDEKDLMRQPAGSVPMPAEAAEAMRKGNRGAARPPAAPPGPPAAPR